MGTTGTCSAVEENMVATVMVGNNPPTCKITAPSDGETIMVNVGATFSCQAHDNNDDPLTYHWDFGDGVTGGVANGVHVWTSLGAFTVALTVSDGIDNAYDQVTVYVQRATGGGPTRPEDEEDAQLPAAKNILLSSVFSFAGFSVAIWMVLAAILLLGLLSDQLGIVTATLFITGFCYVFSDRLLAMFGEAPVIAAPAAGNNILLLPVVNLMGINIMLGVILAGIAIVAYWQKQYGILTMTIVVTGLLFMLSDQLIAAIV